MMLESKIVTRQLACWQDSDPTTGTLDNWHAGKIATRLLARLTTGMLQKSERTIDSAGCAGCLEALGIATLLGEVAKTLPLPCLRCLRG